jgi:hypothetical protein
MAVYASACIVPGITTPPEEDELLEEDELDELLDDELDELLEPGLIGITFVSGLVLSNIF